MQPPKTSEELAEMCPDLEPWQRDELEVWHRGWITKLITGRATSEEYNAAIPPQPDPIILKNRTKDLKSKKDTRNNKKIHSKNTL